MMYSVLAGKLDGKLDVVIQDIQARSLEEAAEKAMTHLHCRFSDIQAFSLIVTDESCEEFTMIGRVKTHFVLSQWEPLFRRLWSHENND